MLLVMLLPSKRETFGLVILEAFAYGVPVVAFSTIFGVDELIEDGVDGYVVPQNGVEEMVKKATFLLLNPKIRDEFADNGRKKAGMYTYEKVMPRYFDLIREVSPVDIDRVELKRNFFKRLDVPQPLLDYITSNYDKEEIETIFAVLEKDTVARIVDGRPMLYNEVLMDRYGLPKELFIIG
ncbi:MAG: glycosyltransferase [Epsilonproteobacteria bacterium]|nr:glycosyltransferase [Campylobacterota bacterium]